MAIKAKKVPSRLATPSDLSKEDIAAITVRTCRDRLAAIGKYVPHQGLPVH